MNKSKYIYSLLIAMLIMVTGCSANQPAIVKERSTAQSIISETMNEIDRYNGFLKTNIPTIQDIMVGQYYIEYYDIMTNKGRNLYSISCSLKTINSVDSIIRKRPIYTLVNITTGENILIEGIVIEANNSEVMSILLNNNIEGTFIAYDFYLKEE